MVRSRVLLVAVLAVQLFATGCIRSALHPLPSPARVTVIDEVASFDSHGESIRVDIYRPSAPGRHPAAIVLHGSGGLHFVMPNTPNRYAEALAESGIAAFVVHYFDGTGHFSTDEREEAESYFQWVNDVRDAITWVLKRPDVMRNRVSLVGVSLGSWLAVGVGAQDTRVYRMALFGGGLEPFLTDSLRLMPPVLMFHGTDDDVVPLSDAQHLLEALTAHHHQAQLKVYPGEQHTFGDSAASDAILRVARFISNRASTRLGRLKLRRH